MKAFKAPHRRHDTALAFTAPILSAKSLTTLQRHLVYLHPFLSGFIYFCSISLLFLLCQIGATRSLAATLSELC